VIVFEDDVVLCRGFRERLESLPVPEDWKMIYLGCILRDVPEPVAPGVVRVRGRTWATHAMMLRAEVLPELHRLLAPWSRRRNRPELPPGRDGEAIDDLLCGLHTRWPVYAAYPYLAWQSPGVSAIDGYLRSVWDNEGRQLACMEVTAQLDALLGLPGRSVRGKAGAPSAGRTLSPVRPPSGNSVRPPSSSTPENPPPPLPPRQVNAPGFTHPARLQTLPAYGLNLDRRPDRRLAAWQQFRKQRLEVTRIRAPDAAAITDTRGWMLKGYRACAAAHRLAFRAARKAGAAGVIIFEDDVVLCEDFRERFAALELPDDWGLFFFGCVFEPPGPELSRFYRRLSARKGDWRLEVPASSDRIVSTMVQNHAVYGVWPPMAWQSKGLSNNMNGVNGNYDPRGRQIPFREAIAHLPWSGTSPAAGKQRRPAVLVTPGNQAAQRDAGNAEPSGLSSGEDSAARAANTRCASLPRPGHSPARARGFLLSPYSTATERMAWAQAELLRKHNPELPVLIHAQDYVPVLPWRQLAEVRTVRGCHSGRDDLRWLNKLEAICDAPFEETIFFDCDMLSTGPVVDWFDSLGTDDFTFWNFQRTPDNTPDTMALNHLNPHRFCPHFGTAAVPSTDGGGHYFARKSGRLQAILDRIAAIMVEAVENPGALYWKFALPGNLVGDEPAASMAMVEMNVKLPPPFPAANGPVGCFNPPYQEWREADFEQGRLRYHCRWAGGERTPQVVHFAANGKQDAAYRAWLEKRAPAGRGAVCQG